MKFSERLIADSIKTKGYQGPNFKGEYQINCPFCAKRNGTQDTKHKLQFNPTKGVYYCYRCSAKGYAEIPSFDGLKELVEAVKEVMPVWLGPPVNFTPLALGGIAMQPFTKYMQGRGLLQQAIAAGAGAVVSGRYERRVVFPLKSPKSPWRGFSARTIVPGVEPPYLYPAGMDRKNEVYGLDFINTEEIWVTEGVMDAVALWPHGVATFGKNITDGQLKKLTVCNKHLVFCLDGDAHELCKSVAYRAFYAMGAKNVSWCHLPPGTDPGKLQWDVRKYIQTI